MQGTDRSQLVGAGRLGVTDHNRAYAAMSYIYPVVSRRAAGVSIGVNLNPNNACNWRCAYCQVPNLKRGRGPQLDMPTLEIELRQMLYDVLSGDFMQRWVAPSQRVLKDIAMSGNGEPTSSPQWVPVVELLARLHAEYQLGAAVKIRLITNGSLLERSSTQQGLAILGQQHGEVWFKCDAATTADWQRINGTRQTAAVVERRLRRSGELCPTWVQSCLFSYAGVPPTSAMLEPWLELLSKVAGSLRGVHLYSLARPSYQPQAQLLGRLNVEQLEAIAQRVRALGIQTSVFA